MAIGDEYRALMEQDMGAAGGVATLDANKKLSEEQWPEPLGLLDGATGNVQTQLDGKEMYSGNITFSEEGWHRIAKKRNYSLNATVGGDSIGCKVRINRIYTGSNTPEYHQLQVLAAYNKFQIISEYNYSNLQLITKARITLDKTNFITYLELYSPYAANVYISISNSSIRDRASSYGPWQAMSPELTEENVDGVTVTTTYDIPANSYPVSEESPELHRTIFRGRNLGTSLTDAQLAAIKAGTFNNLYLGDYWVINGVNWRIADFDYWYRCGDTSFTNHHLVIIPDTALYTAQMNATNTTAGGYVGSLMYTENLEQAKTAFQEAFGDALLTHREYLVNAVTDGRPSAGAWFDSTVELPNEIMIYGSHVFTPANDGSTIPARYTINNSQLALMQACPKFIKTRYTYWLRDVVSTVAFADVLNEGRASLNGASLSRGVRPVAAIG